MIRKRLLPLLFLSASALSLLLLLLAPPARGGEERTRSAPQAREAAGLGQLVARVRRAVSDPTDDGFRLVFVASEEGHYLETFGDLEPAAAIDLARRLHALGDLLEASADIDDEEDSEEFDDEDEDGEEEDESEDLDEQDEEE